MPDPQDQKKKPANNTLAVGMTPPPVNVGQSISTPSQNIVQRLMGGVMSDRMAQKYPEVEKAYSGRSIEFPENARAVTRIGEMGTLKKMLTGGAYGSTSPFGTIELNMDAIKKDNQDINDVLAHEMAHAGQGMMAHIKSMFGDRTAENNAINTEAFRKVRKTDIPLRGK